MKTPDLQGLSSRPVADCTSAEVAAAFTRSFEGYVVPLRFTPEAYERRFRGEDLDPYASRVYERDGAPAGVVLIARRGWTSRVAAMGIAPELRGCGVGRQVMAAAIAEARARGERTMILEVIDGNATFEAAVQFSKAEGILPAPESAHAVRVAIDEALRARESGEKKVIAFNLSGHGHFDMSAYEQFHQGKLQDHEYPTAMVEEAMAHLPQVTVG